MNEIEKIVLDYLESRDNNWKWVFGQQVLGRDETIRLFKKNKRFRKQIVKAVVETATDLFVRGGKAEGSRRGASLRRSH